MAIRECSMSNRQEFPQVVTWGDGVDVPEESIAISVNQRRGAIAFFTRGILLGTI